MIEPVTLPVIIIGGGGHARVVLDVLRNMSCTVLGYLDHAETEGVGGIAYLGHDDTIGKYSPGTVLLANGVGSTGVPAGRAEVFERFKGLGYSFISIAHPSAVVADDVTVGEGCQIMAGSILQPGVRCGDNVLVNTRAAIDHDCVVGAHVHISPGATVCGDVTIGAVSHVGAGSVVLQGVKVGTRAVIGAGAVVVRPVTDDATVVGVPARPL